MISYNNKGSIDSLQNSENFIWGKLNYSIYKNKKVNTYI